MNPTLEHPHAKKLFWLAAVLFLISGFFASFELKFNADDFYILRAVQEHGAFGIWSDSTNPFFRPLTSLSFYLNLPLLPGSAISLHFVNILLHCLNSFLVYHILLRVRLPRSANTLWACFGSIIFLWMPVHGEAVFWIAGRTDLLASFFVLCAVLILQRAQNPLLAVASLLLGSLCKESALFAPIGMWFLKPWLFGEYTFPKPKLTWANLLLAPLAIHLMLRFGITGSFISSSGTGLNLSLTGLMKNLPVYLSKPFFTVSPIDVQSLGAEDTQSKVIILLALIGVVFVSILLIAQLGSRQKNMRTMLLVTAGYLALCGPTLLMWISPFTSEGERFLYLPSVVCAGWIASLLSNPRTIALLIGCNIAGFTLAKQHWIYAGDTAARSIEYLRQLPPESVIASVPDSFRGAYILRTGLNDAIASRNEQPQNMLQHLSTFSMQYKTDFPIWDASEKILRLPAGSRAYFAPGNPSSSFPIQLSPKTVYINSVKRLDPRTLKVE